MKQSLFFLLIAASLFVARNVHPAAIVKIKPAAIADAKQEIQMLIRNMLKWAEANKRFEVLPALPDRKDSLYTGFDYKQLAKNQEMLKATNYFTTGFIANYRHIILTLDKKLKNKEFGPWPVGDLPVFSFANDVDPWTLSQDVPYDKPDPLNFVAIEVIRLDNTKGDLYWKWGGLKPTTPGDWKAFKYKFKVEKENGRWKISYLEGFDYQRAIR